MKALIYSSNGSRLAEFAACVAALDENAQVTALVIGSSEQAQAASAFASEVYLVEQPADVPAEMLLPGVAAEVAQQHVDLFLTGNDSLERSVAAYVATACGTSAVAGASEIRLADGVLCASRTVYGGGAVQTLQAQGPLVASVVAGIAEPGEAVCSGSVVAWDVTPAFQANVVEVREKPSSGGDVENAKIVVGAGRGFTSVEDLAYAEDLASALGGEVGYSRPVTELNPPIVEGAPYLGVSGLQIKPDLYFALAVSGQTQHTIGVAGAKVVAAINKDPNALIFKRSDYGIVADYKEAVPVLIKAIEQAR